MTTAPHDEGDFEVVLFDLDDDGSEVETWRGSASKLVEDNVEDEEVAEAVIALREGRVPEDIGGGAFPRTRVRRADR